MEDAHAGRVAERLMERGWRLATAESVTAGLIADLAAQAPDASSWFLGGLVAYSSEVKERQLGVPPGPVINAETAEQMARGAAQLLDADVVLSSTGVGGPEPVEGQEAGTVWLGLWVDGHVEHHRITVPGDPEDVCTGAAEAAFRLLAEHLDRQQELAPPA